ncbi:hypothetical protein BDZ94DRAFT_1322673 [Collybia nuda]|uniref:Uncharacterized protein n=1 Tax=Collybia nuda TaxID=64659 RepID=A0A9P5Y4V8_9AGAR|nr:hypothetical protein BDZ94DRAFT_1322673 [Collybia nuda]
MFTLENKEPPSSHPRKPKKSHLAGSRSPNRGSPSPDTRLLQEHVTVGPTRPEVHIAAPDAFSHQLDIVEPIDAEQTTLSNHQRVDLPAFEELIQMEIGSDSFLNDDCSLDWDCNATPHEPRDKTRGAETGNEQDNNEGDPLGGFVFEKTGVFLEPPSVEQIKLAHEDIKKILKPPRAKGAGYQPHGLDEFVCSRLEAMKMFMWKYIDDRKKLGWVLASLETASDHQRGPYHAHRLREWTRGFVDNCKNIPINEYGTWKMSMLDDEDFAQAIHLHLQTLGPYIQAQDVVDFVKRPETALQFELKKSISLATAQ